MLFVPTIRCNKKPLFSSLTESGGFFCVYTSLKRGHDSRYNLHTFSQRRTGYMPHTRQLKSHVGWAGFFAHLFKRLQYIAWARTACAHPTRLDNLVRYSPEKPGRVGTRCSCPPFDVTKNRFFRH